MSDEQGLGANAPPCPWSSGLGPIDRAWVTPTVGMLALGMGLDRAARGWPDYDPVDLGTLADALEEAGCTNQVLLEVVRQGLPGVTQLLRLICYAALMRCS